MLIIPNLIMATSMNIAASDGMLNAVIGADTLADGSQAHDEYRLVTTAETYKFDGTLTVSGNITITGVHNPSSGRISCIQPAVLSDGSIPGTMLVMTGDNTKGMLKDLYLLAVATNNTASGAGVAVEVKGDSSNLYVDHCVFDGWQTFAIAYNGQWDSFFITNSHFRNMVHPNQHYIGEVLRNTWPGEAYTDSVVMTNNVMLAVNGYAAAPVTKWYQTYFEFSYNKVLYTFKNPFFIFNVTDAKINNNWFYGAYSGGVAGGENPWWDVLWNADADGTFGVIALNQLSPANGAMFDANYDSTNAAATEALRMIEVKNNVYYWPSGVTDHWAAASAAGTIIDIDTDSDGTADSNLFVAPQWMDNQTMAMFNDDAAYPNLDMSNNVNADPGFMTSLDADILNGSGGADVGLLSWFDEIRGATATTNVWGYAYTQLSEEVGNRLPTWPLPEAAALHSQNMTMNIAASDGMLNAVIGADTLADGSQAHDEYRLVTTAETYKFDGTLTVSGNITITGVHNPSSGRISCIQPAVLSDGSIPGTMLVMTGDNTKGMLKDLYLLAVATNNTASGAGVAVEVKGDSSNLYVDHCVFDGWQTFAIAYNGQWDSFFITNSHFRNMVHPNQHYIGEVLRNTWPGEAYTDSVVMTNNVMLAVNGYAAAPVTKWYQTYFEFSYNKVLYTFKNPFFIFNVTDAKINNNWFYGAYSGGVAGGENPWWDVLWNADADGTFGVIALNQLSPANGAMFDANYDSTNAAATEALRMIEVKNNVYYWPSGVTDHWAAASAAGTIIDIDTDSDGTADSNLFVAPQWMDNQTMAMFNDDAAYPNLDMSNNVNADPGFMTSLDADILNGSGGADVGLLSWFDEIRGATATTNVWGYAYTQVTDAADYVPTWPLPEAAALTGGVLFAADELIETLPQQFALHNNYPNPFNPTTKISYSLSSASEVSLSIYNIRGELVNKLTSGLHEPGTHVVLWNGRNGLGEKVSTGVYIYSLSTPTGYLNKRLVLLK